MYKNFTLTESERAEILKQHNKYGYKQPLNEQPVGNETFDSENTPEAHDSYEEPIDNMEEMGDDEYGQQLSKLAKTMENRDQFSGNQHYYVPEGLDHEYTYNSGVYAWVKEDKLYAILADDVMSDDRFDKFMTSNGYKKTSNIPVPPMEDVRDVQDDKLDMFEETPLDGFDDEEDGNYEDTFGKFDPDYFEDSEEGFSDKMTNRDINRKMKIDPVGIADYYKGSPNAKSSAIKRDEHGREIKWSPIKDNDMPLDKYIKSDDFIRRMHKNIKNKRNKQF